MLGRLQMEVDDCIVAYERFMRDVAQNLPTIDAIQEHIIKSGKLLAERFCSEPEHGSRVFVAALLRFIAMLCANGNVFLESFLRGPKSHVRQHASGAIALPVLPAHDYRCWRLSWHRSLGLRLAGLWVRPARPIALRWVERP